MVYKSKPYERRAKGLTLVELLVAVSILALVAVMGWRGLDGIVRARVAISTDMELTRRMQITFAQLQSDCTQIASIEALSGRQALMVSDGVLILRRTVDNEKQAMWFEVVSYRVVDGTLIRSESAPTRDMQELDQMWNSALQGIDHGGVDLQAKVSSMTMRVWLDGIWVPAAQADLSAGTPSGLEVQMKIADHQIPIVKALLMGVN